MQTAASERDSWRQQYEELRDRKLRDSGAADRQAQVAALTLTPLTTLTQHLLCVCRPVHPQRTLFQMRLDVALLAQQRRSQAPDFAGSNMAGEPESGVTCVQVISQLMERSEEATQQARELAAEAEQLQV